MNEMKRKEKRGERGGRYLLRQNMAEWLTTDSREGDGMKVSLGLV
jgi:hypothetical protein